MEGVLNWLWQGSVVALSAAAVLRAMSSSAAQARYVTVWTATAAVLLLPFVSWLPYSSTTEAAAVSLQLPVASAPGGWPVSSAIAGGLWVAWAGFAIAAGLSQILKVRAARSLCRPFSRRREARLGHWRDFGRHGRRANLVLCDRVRAAAVLGAGSPVIAISPSLLDKLTDEALDRVVVHEWAHVQRRDDIADLVRLGVRIIAGWHPAVWWLDRRLTHEREIACDEMTVAITGDARQYAACLMMLAGLQASTRRPIPALGVVSASGLGDRVVRILALCQVASPRPWRAVAATGCAALLTFAWAIGGFAFVELVPAGRRVPALPAETREDRRGVDEVLAPVAAEPRPAPRARRRASAGLPVDHGLEGAPSSRTAVDARAELRQAPQAAARPVEPAPRRPFPPVAPLEALPVGAPGPASLEPVGPPVPGSLVPIPASSSRPAPWAVAADGGVAIGRGSRRAAVATAGFFNRFANRVAGAF